MQRVYLVQGDFSKPAVVCEDQADAEVLAKQFGAKVVTLPLIDAERNTAAMQVGNYALSIDLREVEEVENES